MRQWLPLAVGIAALALIFAVLRYHVVSARHGVVGAASALLVYAIAGSVVYAARGDSAGLRRFLFGWRPGLYGGPLAIFCAIALFALVRALG